MSVIVISFVTLDGIMTDPDGSSGSERGGWMFRFGREAVDGDPFRLGPILGEAVLLFGRGTWEHFARLWPTREEDFAQRMNAATKLVATRTEINASTWANSTALDGDLLDAVKNELRDVVLFGSLSVARELAAADLVDEYRLVTFPTVVGSGEPLFAPDGPSAEFECVTAEPVGPLVLTVYRRTLS
jgi:dihydrofolate reductase